MRITQNHPYRTIPHFGHIKEFDIFSLKIMQPPGHMDKQMERQTVLFPYRPNFVNSGITNIIEEIQNIGNL